jgi:serine protease Do
LGVSVGAVPAEESKKLGLPRYRGAKLSEVIRGGPADKAGLQRGDVIVEFNGKTVVTWQSLPRLVARARPDDDAEVKFYRKGNLKTLRVRLGRRTEAPKRAKDGSWDSLGMRIESLNPQLASRFHLPSATSAKGLIVTAVKRGGPAERGGVRAGDRIKEVNHTPVSTLSEFQKARDRNSTEGHLLLLLQRRESDIFAAIQFQ